MARRATASRKESPAARRDAGLALESLPARDREILLEMRLEIDRSMHDLRLPGHPRPYFISHLVKVHDAAEVWGKYGSVFQSRQESKAVIYTEVRVGSYRSDQLVDGGLEGDPTQLHSYDWIEGPLELETDALRYSLWRLTQFKYEEALHQYYDKRKLQVEQRLDGRSTGFARERPFRYYQAGERSRFPLARWERLVRDHTRRFKRTKDVIDPHIEIRARRQARYYVNSEGAEFVTHEPYFETILRGWVQGSEGRYLPLHRLFYGRSPGDIPDDDQIERAAHELASDLRGLKRAIPLPPYEGPALLAGAAAGLLFHEALGHRLEGERLVSRSEGQTFSGRLGQQILPAGISVYDDPTMASFGGVPLHGHYRVDDEGVPAQRASLVEDGVLVGFLASRTLPPGVARSNGHGRNASFEDPMARMATLVVEGAQPRPWRELKEMLLAEVNQRGREYGLIIRGVEGGETTTRNYDFQAFKGTPTEVYRVDAKTGAESRVRDVEFIGTPLASLQRIVAVGDEIDVDNSYCVAESGAVPVSTIAPPILVSEIELQMAGGKTYLSPILPPPWSKGSP